MGSDAPAAPAEGRVRRMSLVSECLARGAVKGTCFPASAKCREWPLTTFFFLDKAPTDKELEETMKTLMTIERFRSKVMTVGKDNYAWSVLDVSEVNVKEHVTRKEIGSEAELRVEMDRLVDSPLVGNGARPLWDLTVLTLKKGAKWTPSPGGPQRQPPVVCVRISHAIGDGLALVGVLNQVCTGVDGSPVKVVDFQRRPVPSPFSLSSFTPFSTIIQLFTLVRYILRCIFDVLKAISVPVGPHDTTTAFCDKSKKVAYSGRRSIVTSPSYPLADFKEIKTRMGCTVNDVVVTCLAGAIQKYNVHHGDPTAKKSPRVRAALPAIYDTNRADGRLRNAWTFVSIPLPMGPMDVRDRLKEVKKRCDRMKSSPEIWATTMLNKFANALLGFPFQAQTVFDYMSRHSMVFTNVPGPTEPVVIFGHQVREMIFGVGNLVSQVSIVSYAGGMGLSLVVDPEEVKGAHLVGDFFGDELAELKKKCA